MVVSRQQRCAGCASTSSNSSPRRYAPELLRQSLSCLQGTSTAPSSKAWDSRRINTSCSGVSRQPPNFSKRRNAHSWTSRWRQGSRVRVTSAEPTLSQLARRLALVVGGIASRCGERRHNRLVPGGWIVRSRPPESTPNHLQSPFLDVRPFAASQRVRASRFFSAGCPTSNLLSISKVGDARIPNIVIPAKAGIQCRLTNAAGSPLKPALECLNRGRGRRQFCGIRHPIR